MTDEYLSLSLSLQDDMQNGRTTALERFLREMNDRDFPALSSNISEINRIVRSESEGATKLATVILQDFALTNKLLKLVNTVSYRQFGGKINTISKAVVILGFETVRNVATALILLEYLQNKSQATQLKDELITAFFAGLVAAQLSHGHHVQDPEEAMICGMYQRLGKLLCTFYFFDKSREIAALIESGMTESKASFKVLGISYNDLGQEIAKSWGFPDRLLAGMQKIEGASIRRPRSEPDRLGLIANIANELCDIAIVDVPEKRQELLEQLLKRYEHGIRFSQRQLKKAMEHGMNEIAERAAILNLSPSQSRLVRVVTEWVGRPPEPEQPEDEDEMEDFALDNLAIAPVEEDDAKPDSGFVLTAGIQDVANALVADFNLNDILQMVLETMYRAMGFEHILLLVRDAASGTMRARFGFGNAIDTLLPKFNFPLKFTPDVFHVVMDKGVDVVIENASADNIASKIPDWFHSTVNAQCFLLLPINVNEKNIGMIYADMAQPDSLQITQEQLSQLRALRNQAVLAIKQKQ